MLIISSPNPCLCTPSIATPACPEDCTCLQLCNIIINALSDDAVGPCAKTGTVDIADTDVYAHDFCACGDDTRYWSIVSYDTDIFVNASITTDGTLSWTTMGADVAGEYGCVIVRVCCGNLSALATVQIGVKDLCLNCNGCSPCESCDECSGSCIDSEINISIQGINSETNTVIQGS